MVSALSFAQTESTDSVRLPPPTIYEQPKKEEVKVEAKNDYIPPVDIRFGNPRKPEESGPSLKLKDEKRYVYTPKDDQGKHFYKKTFLRAQFAYFNLTNPYVRAKSKYYFCVNATQPLRGEKTNIGLGGTIGKFSWSLDDRNDYPMNWTFAGDVTEWSAYAITEILQNSKEVNYQAIEVGLASKEEIIEGGFVDEIHLKETKKTSYLYAGYQVDFYRNEERRVANRVSLLLKAWIPLSSSLERKIDGVKQKVKNDISDQLKLFAEFEVSWLSFQVFNKKTGIVVSTIANYTHEGTDKDIYSGGAAVTLFFDYNEVIKAQYKAVMNPSDESKTGTSTLFIVTVDGFGILRTLRIVK